MFHKDEATDLLVSLLKAESEPDMSKEPILNVVMPLLSEMGLEVRRHENDGKPAIFATQGKPVIMLNGHLDTVVRGDDWEHGQGEVVGDRVYGRGALDMKGPCVSMLLAARALMDEGHDIAITFTTDEEVGMQGAKVLAREHPEIRDMPLILICEPTDFRPVIEEKGIVQMRVSAYGRSAHASMPEEGSNAIDNLLFRLQALLESSFFGATSKDPVTLSIGKISGGTLVNVIPESAQADIDVRFSADHTNDEVENLIKILLKTEDGLAETEMLHQLPPARSGLDKEVIKALEEHLGTSSGSVPYGTEMAVFAGVNPNILVLGPGETTLAHTVNEWFDINDVVRTAEVYHHVGSHIAPRL